MVHTCCVYGCSEQQCNDKSSFFRIPAVRANSTLEQQALMKKRRRSWAIALQRELLSDDKLTNLRVCEQHFVSGKPAHLLDTENVDWVPNQQLQLLPGPSVRQRLALSPRRRFLTKKRKLFQNGEGEKNAVVDCDTDGWNGFSSALQTDSCSCIPDSASPIATESAAGDIETLQPEGMISGKPAHLLRTEHVTDSIPNEELILVTRPTAQQEHDLSPKRKCSMIERRQLFQTNKEEVDMERDRNTSNELSGFLQSDSRVPNSGSPIGNKSADCDIAVLKLKLELRLKTEEISQLKKEVAMLKWTEETFVNDKAKVKFFTALPNYDVLHLILDQVDKYLNGIRVNGVSNFQKLLLTLMKLRNNYKYTELAYRFQIKKMQVSRIFKGVICILYAVFKDVVHWPERDCLQRNVPRCFKEKFGNKVAIVIDCFEIFTESPATMKAKAEIFSSYKGHYTIKYLVGITTHGCVSFISEGWGGRTSDKELTESCGILDNLLPGDIVLADRGFTVAESVGFHQAALKIPTFTKGKKQLDPADIELTRKIASVRIHVERVIGLLRNKFNILRSTLPILLLKDKEVHQEKILIDKIVHVCSALANMCTPIITDKKLYNRYDSLSRSLASKSVLPEGETI